jgi:hypothetical protein
MATNLSLNECLCWAAHRCRPRSSHRPGDAIETGLLNRSFQRSWRARSPGALVAVVEHMPICQIASSLTAELDKGRAIIVCSSQPEERCGWYYGYSSEDPGVTLRQCHGNADPGVSVPAHQKG